MCVGVCVHLYACVCAFVWVHVCGSARICLCVCKVIGRFSGKDREECPSGENNYVHNSVERYDVSTNSWEILKPMPIPRLGFGIAAIGDKVYIAGGMTGK